MSFTPAGRGEGGWTPLVEGAIVHRAYDLPDPVLHAVEARQRLHELQLVTIPAETPLTDWLLDAARNRKPLPGTDVASLDVIATATARVVARETVARSLYDAQERAGWAVRGAIGDHADEALTLLRQAHSEVVGEATKLVDTIGTHGLTDVWPDEPPAPVRTARGKLKPVAVRYGHIRTGRRALAAFLPALRYDLDDEFGAMTNRRDLFQPSWMSPTAPPWDQQPTPDAKLWMMIAMGCELSMLSPGEMDAAYAQAYPESGRVTGKAGMTASNERGAEFTTGVGPVRIART